MNVETTRAEYAARTDQWQRCRDATAGQDAIKAAGDKYLPRIGDSTDKGQKIYKKYLEKAEWYGASARTVEGLAGAIFRKAPAVDSLPKEIQAHMADVTLNGVSLDGFARQAVSEILTVGRGGVLVDVTDTPTEKARPYWVWYSTEQIVNWRTVSINGDERLLMVVLKETIEEPDAADWFLTKSVTQYRVLRLTTPPEYVATPKETAPRYYEVTLWRKAEQGNAWTPVETKTPTRRGERLDFIPFTFVSPEDTTTDVQLPPLLSLVDVNISHYRSSADYEWGLHWTALPTPWATGVKSNSPLLIGSGIAWTHEDPQAKVGMLEYQGHGLGAIEKALEKKEQRMAVLGARLLEQQKRDAESAETLRIRAAGDGSVLAKIAGAVSLALSRSAQFHTWWTGTGAIDLKVAVKLNTDFIGAKLTADEVKTALLQWQGGAISYETFFFLLSEGGWMRPGVTAEQEIKQITHEVDLFPKPTTTLPGDEPPDPEEDDVADPPDPDKPPKKSGKENAE